MKNYSSKSGIVGKMQFVLPFVMLFGLSACGGGNGGGDDGGGTNPPPTNPPPTTPTVKTFPGQLGAMAAIDGTNWDLIRSGMEVIDVSFVNHNANEVSVGTFESDDPNFVYPDDRKYVLFGLNGVTNLEPSDASVPVIFYKDSSGSGFSGTVCVDFDFFEEIIIDVEGDVTGTLKFTRCTFNPADISDTWVPALVSIPGPNEAPIIAEHGINIVNDDVDPENRFPIVYLGQPILDEANISPSGLDIGVETAVLFGIVDARTGAVCLPIDLFFGYLSPKIAAEPDANVSYPYTNEELALQMGDDRVVSNITFLSNCVYDLADYQ